jgi:hypothetical protein
VAIGLQENGHESSPSKFYIRGSEKICSPDVAGFKRASLAALSGVELKLRGKLKAVSDWEMTWLP